MGEGTAACLVSADGDSDRLLGFATRTHGRYSEEFPRIRLTPDSSRSTTPPWPP